MASILQPWVEKIGLREQGVLLASVRGADGITKHNNSKELNRFLRMWVLNPFDARELADKEPGSFMKPSSKSFYFFVFCYLAFEKDHDSYPYHFTMHLIHAYEVLGYHHPDTEVRKHCLDFYNLMCSAMHMHPENVYDMGERLSKIVEFQP